MKSIAVRFAAASCALAWLASPAAAASFQYDAEYLGNNVASLLPGSDTPGLIALEDSFAYSLQAQAGMGWQVNTTTSYFALFALPTFESANRIGDVELTLTLGGVTQFSYVENGLQTGWVHVGTNTVTLPAGLTYDKLAFTYTLHSAEAVDDDGNGTGVPSDTTLSGSSLIFGAPEYHFGGGTSYVALVPEPGTWALMLGGLALFGAAARRSRSA